MKEEAETVASEESDCSQDEHMNTESLPLDY